MNFLILDIALWLLGSAWLFYAIHSHIREANAQIEALHAANAALIQFARKQTAWIDGLEAMNLCLRRRLSRFERKRGAQGRFIKST
jgi:hypothetical protein